MQIKFRLPVDDSPDILLVHSPWTSRSQVFVDGAEVRGERRGRVRYFRLRLPDGAAAELQLKNTGIDVLPRGTLVFGDPPKSVAVSLARALAWWEYLLCGLPLLLAPASGIVGGIVGALGAYLNLLVMRSGLAPPLRVLAALGVLLTATVIVISISLIAGGGR
ncbi:MAG TPA: hypothetical protein VG329_01330 [Candidatus Dormibacteraeota bacterium]|nr:hypothetical protein [Candidatus Dormibacteraeota bacterium]